MANDWYRKNTWAEDDEKDFFLKLSKARNFNKPQYLRIQAYTLYETNNHKYFNAAINLLKKCINEYPDEYLQITESYSLLGDIYYELKKYDIAFENYNNAIMSEKESRITSPSAYIGYSLLVLQLNKIELFEKVELLLLNLIEKYTALMGFPKYRYKINAILSVLYRYKNEMEKANYYKTLAEKAANSETSDFRYHKKLKKKKNRNKLLDKLMKKIK
jgi:tetratricopeptide (TPR) repeat protein